MVDVMLLGLVVGAWVSAWRRGNLEWDEPPRRFLVVWDEDQSGGDGVLSGWATFETNWHQLHYWKVLGCAFLFSGLGALLASATEILLRD